MEQLFSLSEQYSAFLLPETRRKAPRIRFTPISSAGQYDSQMSGLHAALLPFTGRKHASVTKSIYHTSACQQSCLFVQEIPQIIVIKNLRNQFTAGDFGFGTWWETKISWKKCIDFRDTSKISVPEILEPFWGNECFCIQQVSLMAVFSMWPVVFASLFLSLVDKVLTFGE